MPSLPSCCTLPGSMMQHCAGRYQCQAQDSSLKRMGLAAQQLTNMLKGGCSMEEGSGVCNEHKQIAFAPGKRCRTAARPGLPPGSVWSSGLHQMQRHLPALSRALPSSKAQEGTPSVNNHDVTGLVVVRSCQTGTHAGIVCLKGNGAHSGSGALHPQACMAKS